MKRYTGQQALYEAISRSRAKAKQGGILDKLLPDSSKTEDHAAKPVSPAEPQRVSEPVVEPTPQVVEMPPQPVIEQEPQVEPRVEVPSEPLVQAAPTAEMPEPVVKPRPVERVAHVAAPSPVQTWLKPRPVQLNEGRIEISVPYYIGVIAGLVVLVVVLVAYRLGQGGSGGQANETAVRVQPASDRSGGSTNPPAGSTPRGVAATDTGRPQSNPVVSGAAGQNAVSAAAQGDHWIVLAQYGKSEDLEKVKDYFAGQGIALGIMSLDAASRKAFVDAGFNGNALPTGAGFLLVTKNLYSNPKIVGTDGYNVTQKIAEVGARYKAPSGFERFAPNYFSDAYPMKIR